MGRFIRVFLVSVIAIAAGFYGPGRALADVSNSTATNIQDGNNSANGHQHGSSTSGDANGGQVAGVVSSGRTSVDATNRSADSSVESGDASGNNSASTFTGQNSSSDPVSVTADVTNVFGVDNVQDGDNRLTYTQNATYSTGDGVAGQVIGAVTAAGGSTSIVAANTSSDVDATTGDAGGDNAFASFTGQNCSSSDTLASDVTNVAAGVCEVQDGSNRTNERQTATATTGDAVAGQVIGSVGAGATSIDARNASTNSDVTTGDADAANSSSAWTGLDCTSGSTVTAVDVSNVGSNCDVQDGSNRTTNSQSATSTTGDGVAGEVIGSVTSAGGSASIVAANGSDNVDVTTGDSDSANSAAAFTGQNCPSDETISASDVSNVVSACSVQDGNNRTTANQTSNASTGDGVAGQVVGAVSAGATSIDANNRSTNSDVTTGDADATNAIASDTGLDCPGAQTVTAVDVSNVDSSCSVQDGNNSFTGNQNATSSSGDGVGGEVIGAVTSAGGSNAIVAANTSDDVSVETGDADAHNAIAAITGLDFPNLVTVTAADIDNVTDVDNIQDGNNRTTANQSSTASTGDGVAGQVIGSVASGRTSIDATNRSVSTDVTTGDADASSALASIVGQNCNDGVLLSADISNSSGSDSCGNIQDGNNRLSAAQTAAATTGDAVGGEVIGAVTSAGGSAAIVASNATTNSSAETGDATSDNGLAAFVGQSTSVEGDVLLSDVTGVNVDATNIQDGNNTLSANQTATATTGDGVAGQVLGVVSAGATSVDASNRTDNSDVTSGDSNATNDASEFVGQNDSPNAVSLADVSSSTAENIQDGNNRKSLAQSAAATSGDGVAGQVSGVVTSAGGSASVVLANTSSSIDSTTGDTRFDNDDAAFVGQNSIGGPLTIG